MILLTSLVLYLGRRVQKVETSMSETRLILHHMDKLRYEMLNRESLTRGFAATGDVAFLSDGLEKQKTIQRLKQLDVLFKDSHLEVQKFFTELKEKIGAKLKFGDLEIGLTETKGAKAAQEKMRTHEGLILGNQIRSLIEAIEHFEEGILQEERSLRERNLDNLLQLSLLGSLGTFLILFYSFFRLRKQIRQLSHAEQQSRAAEASLQKMNIDLQNVKNRLEENVNERTRELKTKEELLKQAVCVAKLGIFNENLLTKEVYFSDEFRQIYGWKTEENYTFEQWLKIVHPDDLKSVIEDIESGYEPHGTGMISLDHRIVLVDGSVRWMSTKAKTFFEGEGEAKHPVRVVGVTLDITERKRYEEIIKKTLESLLEEKSKLAESNKSLERFASVAAHDLRAPIRSMGLWIEMLDQCIPQPWPDDLFRAIEILKMNSSKSSALIDDLLEIAKVTPKQSEIHPVDLKVLLAHILAPHQEEIESRGIKVVLGELLTLQGNPVQWDSVLGNLIRNALIYQDKDKSGEIRIWAEVAQNYYHVFVQDNGIGIASQYQQKIFEMFERLHSDSEYPGTGIGLALCKKIVQGWGGQISLDSEPGRGSTFCVSYPRESSFGERKSA